MLWLNGVFCLVVCFVLLGLFGWFLILMSFLCLILLLWHAFGVVNEPAVFLCCQPWNTSGVWVQSTNPVGLTEVGLKLLTGGHIWGRWEQWRLPDSRYRGREELQYLWGAGSCSQGRWGAQTQCGVRRNAQSCWSRGFPAPTGGRWEEVHPVFLQVTYRA